MAIGAKRRFEILKRDRYTCHYCGRTPPDVLLEIDHVLAKANGGTDEDENLITSCQDCNRGKGAEALESSLAAQVGQKSAHAVRERLEQAKAYAAVLAEVESAYDDMIAMVHERWWAALGSGQTNEKGEMLCNAYFPEDASVRALLRRGLPLETMLEMVDVTAARVGSFQRARPSKYFFKCCWNRLREDHGYAGS